MLCSISTGKSRSNWLDRLRTSKGLPVTADVDLEHFLNRNPNPNSPPPETDTSDPPVPNPSGFLRRQKTNTSHDSVTVKKIEDQKEQWFDLMSSVLAELFVMGDPQESPAFRPPRERKSSRKQPNPRVCVRSASESVEGSCLAGSQGAFRAPATSPSSVDNSVAEEKKCPMKPRRKRGTCGPMDSDLSAYSRAEVTVIDTSSQTWKSEKLIVRKGTIWKVREKKSWSMCRKKRKLGLVERLVTEKEKEQPLIDFKAPSRKEHLASLNAGWMPTDRKDASKETHDHNPISKRRPKFSRSPRRPAAKDSSVFRLKVITTSRKNVSSCSGSALKGK